MSRVTEDWCRSWGSRRLKRRTEGVRVLQRRQAGCQPADTHRRDCGPGRSHLPLRAAGKSLHGPIVQDLTQAAKHARKAATPHPALRGPAVSRPLPPHPPLPGAA